MRSLKTDKKAYFLGVLLGLFSAVSPSSFIILAALALVSWAMYSGLPQEDRDFVIGVFLAGVAIRMIFSALFYYLYLLPGRLNFIAPDGETYSQQAWYISNVLAGRSLYAIPTPEFIFSNFFEHVNYYAGRIPAVGEYEIGLATYFMAFLYTIFGYVPLAFKMINSILSGLSVIIVYDIAKSIFGRKTAFLSMLLVMFWPTIMIFSATNLKDPAIIFFLCLHIWAMLKSQKEVRLVYVATAGISLVMILMLRTHIALILLATAGIFFSGSLMIRLKPAIRAAAAILIVIVILSPAIQDIFWKGINTMLTKQEGFSYVKGGTSNYKIYPEAFYRSGGRAREISTVGLILSYFKGVSYFMFSPFPWQTKSFQLLWGALLNMLWYIAFAFSIKGAAVAFKCVRREFLYIGIFLFIMISVFALTSGNIGTVCRHRDMVVPFFLIFASAGIAGAKGDESS